MTQIRWAANTSAIFGATPLNLRPAAAREAGFDLIECWWPFDTATPRKVEVSAFCDAIEAAEVRLIAMNLFGGTLGRRGVLSHSEHVDEFRSSLGTSVAIAERLGTTLFNAPYGTSLPAVPSADQDAVAADNLASAAAALSTVSGTVLLEPLSSPQPTVDSFPLNTLERADAVARQSGAPNVQLLFDQYHLEANGLDPVAELQRWAHRVAHVQVADSPGRGEPGSGHTDFGAFFSELVATGYGGYVALEYFATAKVDDPLHHWRENRARWEEGR